MSEGVQASANPADASPNKLLTAIYPIVLGVLSVVGSWDAPQGSLARTILLVGGIAIIVAGGALGVTRRPVHNPRDYYGGLALLGLAMLPYLASSHLPGMHAFAFGPGTAPRLFAGVLVALGVAVAATGLFTEGPGLEGWAFRGPLFITAATIIFAITIRHFGLVVASFVSICVSSMG